jgi:putative tricarboxylic transport membrane protein
MAFQNLKGWTAEKDPNLWASLFLIIVSGAVISEALELEVGSPGNPGSGFMIFGAAAILGLLALHQFVKSLGLRKPKSEAASERIHWARIVAVIVANALYIYLLQPIGYLLCTFLLMCFLFQALERGRWVPRVIGSALASLFTYLLFARLLQLNLPRGLISFF